MIANKTMNGQRFFCPNIIYGTEVISVTKTVVARNAPCNELHWTIHRGILRYSDPSDGLKAIRGNEQTFELGEENMSIITFKIATVPCSIKFEDLNLFYDHQTMNQQCKLGTINISYLLFPALATLASSSLILASSRSAASFSIFLISASKSFSTHLAPFAGAHSAFRVTARTPKALVKFEEIVCQSSKNRMDIELNNRYKKRGEDAEPEKWQPRQITSSLSPEWADMTLKNEALWKRHPRPPSVTFRMSLIVPWAWSECRRDW